MAKGNQEKAVKTLQSTRKKTFNMSKKEPAAELKEHRTNKAKYRSSICELQELKKEVSEVKESLNELNQVKTPITTLKQT